MIGLVVETGCHYFEPLTYPETVTAAMRVAHVGNSSVRYEIALFGEGRDERGGAGPLRARVRRPRDAPSDARCPRRWRRALATIGTEGQSP